jgi:cell division protein FtsL
MPLPQKSVEQKIFYSPLFVIFLLVIIFITASGLVKIFYKAQKIKAETAQLQAKIEEINLDNQNLASQKKYYSSPYFIEKEARLQLNLKKPGEQVVFIDYNPEILEKEARLKNMNPLVINFLDWWAYFFNHAK